MIYFSFVEFEIENYFGQIGSITKAIEVFFVNLAINVE